MIFKPETIQNLWGRNPWIWIGYTYLIALFVGLFLIGVGIIGKIAPLMADLDNTTKVVFLSVIAFAYGLLVIATLLITGYLSKRVFFYLRPKHGYWLKFNETIYFCHYKYRRNGDYVFLIGHNLTSLPFENLGNDDYALTLKQLESHIANTRNGAKNLGRDRKRETFL